MWGGKRKSGRPPPTYITTYGVMYGVCYCMSTLVCMCTFMYTLVCQWFVCAVGYRSLYMEYPSPAPAMVCNKK